MADDTKQPSEDDIASRSGMGVPEATPREEENDTETGKAPHSQKEEDIDDEEDETSEDDEDSDEDSEDDDESEDSEKDEDESDSKEKRSVPYTRLKHERAKTKQLQTDLSDRRELTTAITALTQALAADKSKDTDDTPDEVESAAKELAEQLGMESGLSAEQLDKVLRKATALAEKRLGGKLPPEIIEKLKVLDGLQAKDQEAAEREQFSSEWKSLVPALKKRYPGATDAMLEEAKEKMDKIAHSDKGGKVIRRGNSEEFIPYELDYIFYRNRKTFTDLLKAAPKSKGGESAHTIHREGEEVEDDGKVKDIDPENFTPESFKREEARDRAAAKAHGKSNSDIRIVKKTNRV